MSDSSLLDPKDTPISNTTNFHQACTCMAGVNLASDHKDPHCLIHGEQPETTLTTHPSNTDNCYCVCHSSVASNAFCEHCKGDNEVGRHHGFAHPSNTEQLDCYLGLCKHYTKEQEKDCWWSQRYNAAKKADPHRLTDWETTVELEAKVKIEELIATHTAEAVREALKAIQSKLPEKVTVSKENTLPDDYVQALARMEGRNYAIDQVNATIEAQLKSQLKNQQGGK